MQGAGLLLHGGRVLTMDPSRPWAEAVVTSAGRILAVGGEQEVRSSVSPRMEKISCRGGAILPGFVDPHLHLFSWASRFSGVDLSPARSISEIQERLRARAATTLLGAWIRGYGYDEFFLREKRHPTRQDLDPVSPSHPILLRHRTGHAAVLNSLALSRVNVGIDGHSPPAAGVIERDPKTGEATGVLYEMERPLRAALPPLSPAELAAGVKKAGAELLRHGVTSFHDASAGNAPVDLSLFQRFIAEGTLRARATVMIGADAPAQFTDTGISSSHEENEWTRPGSIKIMVSENRGEPFPSPEELTQRVWETHGQGFQVAIHAVEEGAIWAALVALGEAQKRLPRADHRHRIEHCALCPPPFVDLLTEMGIGVVTQPAFLYYYGEKYLLEVEAQRHPWLYRARSFLQHGVPLAFSSDCPTAPLNPLIGVQAAVTRRSQEGNVIGFDERLSPYAALQMSTRGGAWMGFEEDRKGTIAPGMYADLIVLDADPTAVSPEGIGQIKVKMTILNGEVVWSDQ